MYQPKIDFKSAFKFVFPFVCLLALSPDSQAQEVIEFHAGALRQESLSEQPRLRQYWAQQPRQSLHSRNTRTCPNVVQNLPFFDDFSQTDSLFPACSHWQEHQAIIGIAIADAPPTIGTATLDGLNQYGQPYNALSNPNLAYSADTLTSQPINLSSYDSTDNVYLSYFYQPQGLGDRPEVGDSLFLEFKNNLGEWTTVRAYAGLSSAQISIHQTPPFTQIVLQLTDTAYFHPDFQFRFRNYASITGNNDHWHIDYVYLDANRNIVQGSLPTYPDVAFNALPQSPIAPYRAMPYLHFRDTMFSDSVKMRTQNLGNISGTLDRRYTVEDLTTATTLLSTPLPALTYAPSPNANDSLNTTFINAFAPLTLSDTTTLLSTYTILNPTDFQNNPLYAYSDTVKCRTHLGNYFAYDDGIAETRIVAQAIGTQVAVEFRTTVEDTLRGVYFHLPYYINRDASQDFINVKVWFSDLNNEVFSRDIYRLQYTNDFNGLHYVELTDFGGIPTPLHIPANTIFYVGWQQASTINVPVGFDKSNDASHKTFVYAQNAWTNSELRGAVMLRPLLSMSPDFDIVGVEREKINAPQSAYFQILPNPSRSNQSCQIAWTMPNDAPKLIRIYNALGQLCTWQQIEPNANNIIDLQLPTLTQGIYFVEILSQNNKTYTQQLQIQD